MRLLLDENVPLPLLSPLRHLLPAHEVDHVERIGWKGKKDRFLLPDASARGYDGLLTKDSAQLDSPEESRAIRDSGIHHIRFRQDSKRGMDGLAGAMAAVVAAIRLVVAELDSCTGQRLVVIQSIAPGRRHEITDPKIDPPPYWPSRVGHPRRPRRPRPDG